MNIPRLLTESYVSSKLEPTSKI